MNNDLRIISVGGGAGNIADHLLELGNYDERCVSMDTHIEALRARKTRQTIQLGKHVCGGRGSGGQPMTGIEAAMDSLDDIRATLDGADAVIIVAAMGGGTGTGAAPVVAREARRMGIYTTGFISLPFGFEGKNRAAKAEAGRVLLREQVDHMITNHFNHHGEANSLLEEFKESDGWHAKALKNAVNDLENRMKGFRELTASDKRHSLYPNKNDEVGSHLSFGGYRFPALSNTYYYSLNWVVAKKEEEKMLLVGEDLSNYDPPAVAFEGDANNNEHLRKWLNEDFISEAFSEYQKNLIAEGEATSNKVFLIDDNDLSRYLPDVEKERRVWGSELPVLGIRTAIWVKI